MMHWAVIYFFTLPVYSLAVPGDIDACKSMLSVMEADIDESYVTDAIALASVPNGPERADISLACLAKAPDIASDAMPDSPVEAQSQQDAPLLGSNQPNNTSPQDAPVSGNAAGGVPALPSDPAATGAGIPAPLGNLQMSTE